MVLFVSPQQAFDLSVETTLLMAESHVVIAMRLWGMAGVWPTADDENARMLNEKSDAFTAAGHAATQAIADGKGAGEIALAALKPLRSKTKSNVARLSNMDCLLSGEQAHAMISRACDP